MTQLISEYEATDHVPGNAVKAEAGVQSRPSDNTPLRLLLTGFKTSTGSMAAGSVIGPIMSDAHAAAVAGPDSELAGGYRLGSLQSTDLDVYFGCVEEPSGSKAFCSVTFSGTWTTPGEIKVLCDGAEFFVTIGESDDTDAVAAAFVAKVATKPTLLITAAASTSTVVVTKTQKGTRGNTSILYIDTTNAPAGLVVTLEPPEGALVSLSAELLSDFTAHIALTTGGVHGAADSGPYTLGSAPTNQATAIARLGQLLTAAKAHVQKTAGSVHGTSDTTALAALNALTAPTTGAEAVAFANAFKAAFFGASGHSTRTTSSIHGAADTTNTITAADATTGAVTGDENTGAGVRFQGGTGTEDVTALLTTLRTNKWFKVIVVSSLDSTNLGLWEAFCDAQAAPLVKRRSRFLLAHHGNQSAVTAITKTQLNHEAFQTLSGYDALTPAMEIAAATAVLRVLKERNGPTLGVEPAAPATQGDSPKPCGWNSSYSGSVLKGVKLALDRTKIPNDHTTQKSMLRNGITPLMLSDAGDVQIVRAISTKCQDANGADDYTALEVAEDVVVSEVAEAEDKAWAFFKGQNPYVRDDFAANEPVTSGVATPKGFSRFLAFYFAPLVQERVFESPCTARSTFNRGTRRIQTRLSFTRMSLFEQGEALIQSLAP